MEEKNIDDFFDTYIYSWLFSDIKICLDNGANFACASLICCGIDAIGGFLMGRDYGFTDFMKSYFPVRYLEHKEFKKIIRDGLVHEYFPKYKSAIGKGHSDFHLERVGSGLYIDTEVFFEDFKKAVKNYRAVLKVDKELQKKFELRYRKIFSEDNKAKLIYNPLDFAGRGSTVSAQRY
jgi:hypothetical protein